MRTNDKLDEATDVTTLETRRPVGDLFHTSTACAGAASAYVLRKIAYRAGAYAPGIQGSVFDELNSPGNGGTLARVQQWFHLRTSFMQQMGYRLKCRFVGAPTPEVIEWVKYGRGYRGAMLPTMFSKLHPDDASQRQPNYQRWVIHAVGLAIDRIDETGDEAVMMVDPWPGLGDARGVSAIPSTLESAHRERSSHALLFAWTGWS